MDTMQLAARRAAVLAGLVTALALLGVSSAIAITKLNRYPVDKVTISVDRHAHRISGRIVASSETEHFCTLGSWPLNVFRVMAGKDKKVAHINPPGAWSFKVPKALRGTRLYAEVPSYRVHEHGYCVGARSRALRAG